MEYRCPSCGTSREPEIKKRFSKWGPPIMILFWPLVLLYFAFIERYRRCPECGLIFEERGISNFTEGQLEKVSKEMGPKEVERRILRDRLIVRCGIPNHVFSVFNLIYFLGTATVLFMIAYLVMMWEKFIMDLFGTADYGFTTETFLFGSMLGLFGLLSIVHFKVGNLSYSPDIPKRIRMYLIASVIISFLSIFVWFSVPMHFFPNAIGFDKDGFFFLFLFSLICLPHIALIVLNLWAFRFYDRNESILNGSFRSEMDQDERIDGDPWA